MAGGVDPKTKDGILGLGGSGQSVPCNGLHFGTGDGVLAQ